MQSDTTICCFASELVERDKGGRPPDNADLVVRALSFLEGFEAYPVGAYPTAERLRFRLRGLHLKSPPRQLPCAPRATGDTGRATGSRPGRPARGKPQPKPYSAPRAAGHRTPGQPRQQAATRRSLPGHRAQPDQQSVRRRGRATQCPGLRRSSMRCVPYDRTARPTYPNNPIAYA